MRLLGSRSAAGFIPTSPFMILYSMLTLFDVLLDCRFNLELCNQCRGTRSRAEVVKGAAS